MCLCLRCMKEMTREELMTFHGFHEKCFCEEFEFSYFEDFKNLTPRESNSLDPLLLKDEFEMMCSSFFHGKFKKFSAKMLQRSYILKSHEDEAPELPAVE